MTHIGDYSDEELIEELKERGYAVYKGKEMQFCITQLERMQNKLLKYKEVLEGDKHGK